MIAAFFDMDRTVLSIDTGTSWMRFLRERGELSRAGMARAVWWSALYKLALLDLETLATRLTADLAGQPEAEMLEKAAIWHRRHVDGTVTPAARRAIARHRERGDLIVLLTGSTQYAAEEVGRSLGIEHVLCSRLEVEAGRFTGRLADMCFGAHKVTIAERFAAAHGVDLARSWFYSDSYNDLPMLRRVGNSVAVNPDGRLRRHARATGWRIEAWA
ncbi:MAG: HAD-IB family hydrolase [Kofleriaceae bacterium]|nr:HAD-IB family hydrolase [Myxococcales bacterium]MCB9564598.1 HAD-IB family hydrolase [Kofleriaceae bacterium]